ncbi:MAG: adenylate/guanylate cyclase domain-containing protein [Leptospiraceae bacterium]|nr:adenylate/guanylate cyclase domain-containing protein [Leptospiraceae bacterium]MCP5497556.1 adenylate/guanylate cyclase domain-containing protein [Leptospiraceae bacterium]
MKNQFELKLEILKSESIRLLILMIMILFSTVLELPVILLPQEYVPKFLQSSSIPIDRHIVLVLSMLFLAIVFAVMYFYVSNLVRLKKSIPTSIVVVNSLSEIMIPTFVAFTFYLSNTNTPYYILLYSKVYPIYVFFVILSILRFRFAFSFFSGFMSALSFALVSLPFTNIGHSEQTVLSFYLLIQGLFAGFVAKQLRKWLRKSIEAIEEQNRIKNIFGQHISEAVMDKLIREKKDKISETQKVCVMFLDIRNFTKFSENKENDEIVRYLDILFESMIDSVTYHQGIINKFLGDGFMAVFGAPFSSDNDTINAIKASKDILKSVKEKVASGKIPPTRIGIGLHTGNVLTGHIGSSKRKEYTIIGDTVNTASRIESLNKEYNTQILFSESVVNEIGNDYPDISYIGESKVKGKEIPIKIYTLDI